MKYFLLLLTVTTLLNGMEPSSDNRILISPSSYQSAVVQPESSPSDNFLTPITKVTKNIFNHFYQLNRGTIHLFDTQPRFATGLTVLTIFGVSCGLTIALKHSSRTLALLEKTIATVAGGGVIASSTLLYDRIMYAQFSESLKKAILEEDVLTLLEYKQQGINLTTIEDFNKEPIFNFAINHASNHALLEPFIDSGADRRIPLILARYIEKQEILHKFLAHHNYPFPPSLPILKRLTKQTIQEDNMAGFKLILSYLINNYIKNTHDLDHYFAVINPLHVAALSDSFKIALFLLEKMKMEVNTPYLKDRNQAAHACLTPLDRLYAHNADQSAPMAKLLLSYGAQCKTTNNTSINTQELSLTTSPTFIHIPNSIRPLSLDLAREDTNIAIALQQREIGISHQARKTYLRQMKK